MKGVTTWSFAPYRPFFFEGGDIYITRLVPESNAFSCEWLGEEGKKYELFFRKENEGEFISAGETTDFTFTVRGLTENTDYEFYLQCACCDGEKKSRVRLVRTGKSVGIVVNYLHPRDKYYSFSGNFLCSPSMVRHPDGYLLASMDLFEGAAPQNLTLIFRSDDNGESWHYVSELYPCFWGKMFLLGRKLYMISCSTEYGDLLIGCSEDGGKTFGMPTVLMRGSCKCNRAGCHKNPQPMVKYRGRIWGTMEWGSWGEGYHAPMIMSFPEDADPMKAENWSFTPPVKYNPNWEGVPKGESSGNIEGSLVIAPDGTFYNIMRYDMGRMTPNFGKVLAYRVDTENPEAPLVFDHAISLPGNHSKFTIHYDQKSGYYYTIICRLLSEKLSGARNLLSLMRSKDLEQWDLVTDLLDFREEDPQKIGFQYVDFFFEGEDILFLCRTAINGADSFHNSNYTTFHRVKNFRQL